MISDTGQTERGALILAGGAEFFPAMSEADRAWLALLTQTNPRVGVLPTAAEQRPDLAANNGVRYFRSLGVEATALMITESKSAADDGILDDIDHLDAAYMAGAALSISRERAAGSPAWRALEAAWRHGMALGGSSAGAMVLCQAIFVQNRWNEELGLVPGTVVPPHFNRLDDSGLEKARSAIAERGMIGLGIDEHTALIWSGGAWRSAGPGRIVIFTAKDMTTYRDGETIAGLPTPG